MHINSLIHSLMEIPSTDVYFNQYQSELLRENFLKFYNAVLAQVGPKILIIGEAPGYKGCRKCGIPFNSWRVMSDDFHPFMTNLNIGKSERKKETERSATIVWNSIPHNAQVPLFWNAFPFHPHKSNNHESNRPPTAQELELIGIPALKRLIDIYNPEHIITLGKVAEESLNSISSIRPLPILSLPHPSHRGTTLFKERFNEFYQTLSNKIAA